MAFMTVSTVITDLETDRAALDAAVKVAHRDNGHLEVLCLGIDPTQPGAYYAGANAITLQSSFAEAESDAHEIEQGIKELLEYKEVHWSARAVSAQLPGLAQFLAHQTRFTDIAVLTRPYGEGRGHEKAAIVESALFDAKIPVVIIPDGTGFPDDVKRVVVAWDESHEALTAVRAAMPILKSAEVVNITLVDPPSHAPDRSDPGGALSLMLSRHGIQAEVSVLAKTMPRISDVIARHVKDQNADMLVMGAYGHSRIRESILGGATRNTLQMTEVPVLMAH